ncbi:MAG: UDP-N-acetylglucosamine--N-acetylmuramyl-(pentapeptide) pyrophosphoryl-undecaprenol N-acetylglucosamine transferase [Phycisphaerae bacterium]|nr:UDP-N-acetylglucosamine--N-acetylmuramyl-(pentapeptide) pyrophosphoryl-undecaprenol N-acetylglucosamine transferase [Phycisphaerae bacterium]
MREPCVIFAGGGTGGHLFPGLAVAESLVRMRPGASSLFACSDRPLDAEILSRAGASFEPLPAKPVSLRPRGLWRFLRGWGPSVRRGTALIRAARSTGCSPVVAAMGGYAAAPVVMAARAERCPVVLVNLDARPGKANRWIARHTARTFTAASVEPMPEGWEWVRPIVRDAARASGPRAGYRRGLGLDPDLPVLMVTGGSQGARSINALMRTLVESRPDALRGWQVLHQTGEHDNAVLIAAYEARGVRAIVQRFSDRMAEWWGGAELAVSRAGAGSVAECWANSVPTLFLPYPYHRDEHQRFNARALERAGAAEVVRDRIEPGANMADAGEALTRLLGDAPARNRMVQAIRGLGPADGAERVAEGILEVWSRASVT